MIDWHRNLIAGLLAGGLLLTHTLAWCDWSGYKSKFENLVPNANFEQFIPTNDEMPNGWIGEAPGALSTAIIESSGFESAHSVSLKGTGQWHTSIKGIIPNTNYLLSFWVKREGWKDGEYPSLKIFDKEIYQNELFAYGGWVPVSYIVNSAHHQETSLIFSSENFSDKIFYDDVSLTKFEINGLWPRNGEAIQGGSITFKWNIPKDSRVYRLKISIADNETFENSSVYQRDSPLGRNFQFPHPLKDGKWFWKIAIFHNRLALAHSEVKSFEVVGSSYTGGLDPYSHTRSNRVAEDFFPIGIYGGPIGAFGELRQAGFNLVQSYNDSFDYIEKFVRTADLYGLKALTSIFRTKKEVPLSSLLNRMKYNPGLYGWYIADEPEGRSLSPHRLWKLSETIHASDPFHPTALVNVRSNKVVDYAPAVDIVMVDPYPIPHRPLTWLSDSIEEARQAVRDTKHVWAVIQAFNWAEGNPEYIEDRFPTYEEGRCLTYLSIVHGVQGVLYFSYKGAMKNDQGQKHWSGIKRIIGELQDVYPLLLVPNLNEKIDLEVIYNDEPNGINKNQIAYDANGKVAIHYTIKNISAHDVQLGNDLISTGKYLIAVNVIGKSVEATFTMKKNNMAKVIFEDRKIAISQNQMKDSFEPYAVHIYKLQ
ncbi:MAG: hypothetical protein ACQ9MH_12625 [Nitrospinales bacterium]